MLSHFFIGISDFPRAAGLAPGGTCEGPPGVRPQYQPNCHAAHLRDPDSNKLGFACHEPEA